jgi:oxygen-independent coproporphyrinogen-3 oxidase
MAGIYIHVPFCRAKCVYCNFFSVATRKFQREFADALVQEIRSCDSYYKEQEIHTLYFGGGTPSMLDKPYLKLVMDAIRSNFVLNKQAEITLEANPDDIDEANLAFWKLLGINRLSIGVQSFVERDLTYLGRNHSAVRAYEAVKLAKQLEFNNLSIDLIYGIPSQTIESLQHNLQTSVALDVTHISAYALTVEPKTALDFQIRNKKRPEVDEEAAYQHFTMVRTILAMYGFEQYEISNFAKDGSYSKHNTAYWQGIPYVGFGPSAHSFDGSSRFWNVASLTKYLAALESGNFEKEREVLSQRDQYNEYVMTGLRTKWGCDANQIRTQFGKDIHRYFERIANPMLGFKLECKSTIYTVKAEALFLTDGIVSQLMLPNE